MPNYRKTKIIATIGPATSSPEKITELINAGVNIFRFNMKHATIEWHNKHIKLVRQAAKLKNAAIGILVDLQGPEIRIETRGGEDIEVKKGQNIVFAKDFKNDSIIKIPQPGAVKILEVGDFFLIDDGSLEFIVTEKQDNHILAQPLISGTVKNHKGINIPGKNINLPSLISDDFKKLDMLSKNKPDFIALSFSRTKRDIDALRKEIVKRKIGAQIVAKIESRQAIENIDELIEFSDAVMIARGDLGIEVPIEELAYLQKRIVKKCRLSQRPVIIATQMLQSMIRNPRPTRAEATDVANAVYDGADAVMLSEETSAGRFPVKAVEAMDRILKYNEQKSDSSKFYFEQKDLKQLVSSAAVSIISDRLNTKINSVIAFTETGYTAKILSSFRTKAAIIAVTDKKETAEALIMSYGIVPIFIEEPIKESQSSGMVINILKKKNIVKKGETLMFVHGAHKKTPGLINSIAIINVI